MPIIPNLEMPTGDFQPVAPSVQAAMAPGQGMEALGKGIGQAGQEMDIVAQKVQDAQDYGVKSKAYLLMQKALADHEQFRADTPDPTTWGADIQGRVASVGEALKGERVSPFAKMELDKMVEGWGQRYTDATKLDVTKQTFAESRQATANLVEARRQAGDYEGAIQTLEGARGKNFRPDEVDMRINTLKAQQKDYQRTEAVRLEVNKAAADPNYLEKYPIGSVIPGHDAVSSLQIQREVAARLDDMTRDSSTKLLDIIDSGKRTLTPDDRKTLGANLSDHAWKKIMDYQGQRQAADYDQQQRDPKVQAATAGAVAAMLANWNPIAQGFDANRVAIQGMIRSLPSDLPIRQELDRNFTQVVDNKSADVKTMAEAGAKAIDTYFKDNVFSKIPDGGKPAEVMPTQTAIDAGYLRSTEKLATLGFDKDQINHIMAGEINQPKSDGRPEWIAPKKVDDNDRQKSFAKLWVSRANPDVNPDPIVMATALAIRDHKPQVEMPLGEAQQAAVSARMAAEIELGKQRAAFAQWSRLNPNATAKEIDEKIFDISGSQLHSDVSKSLLSPRPSAPAANPANSWNGDETGFTLPAGLEPHRASFIAAGDRHGVDPRVLAAISMNETGLGTSHALRVKNNAMGVSDASGPISFARVDDSINQMARLLGSKTSGPYKDASTIRQIGAIYAPPGAINDPHNNNPGWADAVSHYMRGYGLDPNLPIK